MRHDSLKLNLHIEQLPDARMFLKTSIAAVERLIEIEVRFLSGCYRLDF